MVYPDKPVERRDLLSDIIIFCTLYTCLSSIFCLAAFLFVRLIWILREILLWRFIYSSFTELITKIIKMQNWPSFVVVCGINMLILIMNLPYNELECKDIITGKKYSLLDFMICLLNVVIGLHFQWVDCPLMESYRQEKSFTLSGGSCMALGFFHGYLKLILPNFLEKINNFQSRQKIDVKKIPEKKLFILIPSSTFIFDKLRRDGREMIEPLEEMLHSHKQDRGMVLNRVYKNTVYKIKNKHNKDVTKYYVPLEGASPLKTFEEICNHEPQFKEMKREVITSFYNTLDILLSQDRNVKGLVELIYYDDEKNPTIEIADVIRERMRYLKKVKYTNTRSL